MGNDKERWQQPNEDHDGGNDEKQKEAGQKARKDMNLQIFQTRTSLSLRALGLLLCPHSGEGGDFLTGQPDFFTWMAVTWERKVEKLFPRWEMNGHSEGYKRDFGPKKTYTS